MLWNASALQGYGIAASDGEIGTVSDLLFADAGWTIHWLVVDTGDWLPGRKFLLPVSSLGQPDAERRHCPVRLSRAQIEASPEFDAEQPVRRPLEASIFGHYALPPYWLDGVEPHHDTPPADTTTLPRQLLSLATLMGNSVEAVDGDIGHVEDVLIDTEYWDIRYITVHTSGWWPGEKVLLSPLSISGIDRMRHVLHFSVTRAQLRDSPPYRPAATVDGAYDESFRTFYGIRMGRR
jgi:sporulation protein YlmC with PRC-barrel domain